MAETVKIIAPGNGLGIDVNLRTSTQQHAMGKKVRSEDGREYTYVKAGEAIAASSVVKYVIGAAPYTSVLKTTTAGISGLEKVLGALSSDAVAFANADFGFLQTGGYCHNVNIISSAVAPGDALQASATAATFTIADVTKLVPISAVCLTDGGSNLGDVMLLGSSS